MRKAFLSAIMVLTLGIMSGVIVHQTTKYLARYAVSQMQNK